MLLIHIVFCIFPNSCRSLFPITQKSKLSVAFDCKLLFLHGVECKVCIIVVIVYSNYLHKWYSDSVVE